MTREVEWLLPLAVISGRRAPRRSRALGAAFGKVRARRGAALLAEFSAGRQRRLVIVKSRPAESRARSSGAKARAAALPTTFSSTEATAHRAKSIPRRDRWTFGTEARSSKTGASSEAAGCGPGRERPATARTHPFGAAEAFAAERRPAVALSAATGAESPAALREILRGPLLPPPAMHHPRAGARILRLGPAVGVLVTRPIGFGSAFLAFVSLFTPGRRSFVAFGGSALFLGHGGERRRSERQREDHYCLFHSMPLVGHYIRSRRQQC